MDVFVLQLAYHFDLVFCYFLFPYDAKLFGPSAQYLCRLPNVLKLQYFLFKIQFGWLHKIYLLDSMLITAMCVFVCAEFIAKI